MKVAVIGVGYVGLANALLLSQICKVTAMDIRRDKLAMVNDHARARGRGKNADQGGVQVSLDLADSVRDADYIIVATPTNYDSTTNCFDTSSVQDVISQTIQHNHDGIIIIKSTIPVGFVDYIRHKTGEQRIVFSPEFLREEHAYEDCLHPYRIVVGDRGAMGRRVAGLFKEAAKNQDAPILLTGTQEAEAIKLFANTYLAMRIAFFNELDSYALARNLKAQDIIAGVSTDKRIGQHYNNPSFGYGGYCLPKDTKQLLANYQKIPQNLIRAIVEANNTRKLFLAQEILKSRPKIVGIYRLISEPHAVNFRQSAIQDIMHYLKGCGVQMIIYEPLIKASTYENIPVIHDEKHFKEQSSIILANRMVPSLNTVADKVFTRDLCSYEEKSME